MYPREETFLIFIYKYDHFNKKNDELKDLEELDDLQSNVKQVRLVQKLGKQGFHYDVRELLEPITKPVTASNQKLLEESKSTTKAIMEVDESKKDIKFLESTKKNEIIHPSSILSVAKTLVQKIKDNLDWLMILTVKIGMIFQ